MRCPKCGTNNYGDVQSCHNCGEPLNASVAQAPPQHRYGPCPYCGNPQAEYFAAGNGQCRACVRTFTWKQETQKQRPGEEETPQSSMFLILIIVVIVAVAASAAAITAILVMGGDDGDGVGNGGAGQSKYLSIGGIDSDLAQPDPGENVTIFTEIDFKETDKYDPYDVHVELFFTYETAGAGAIASNHAAMEIYWMDVPQTLNITGPLESIRYTTVLSINDADGPVDMQVKIYKNAEWDNSKKELDEKLTLVESSVENDILSY